MQKWRLEGAPWVAATEPPADDLLPQAGWGVGQEAALHADAPPAADRCLLGSHPAEHLDPFKAPRGGALGPTLQTLHTCQAPLKAAN